MIKIRPFEDADWPALWSILEPVFRAGDTYSFAVDIPESEARSVWVERPASTFIAESGVGKILGTYYLKPNQPGQGAHVCNCGYVVGAAAHGMGIASRMCEHSQKEALLLGFRSMQYNLVVSTNTNAVRLWRKHGFKIAGTLPKAFCHPAEGDVDAYVMYKQLQP